MVKVMGFEIPKGAELVMATSWHSWFAWRPVTLKSEYNPTPRWAWLRTVMRQRKATMRQGERPESLVVVSEWLYEEPFTIAALYE